MPRPRGCGAGHEPGGLRGRPPGRSPPAGAAPASQPWPVVRRARPRRRPAVTGRCGGPARDAPRQRQGRYRTPCLPASRQPALVGGPVRRFGRRGAPGQQARHYQSVRQLRPRSGRPTGPSRGRRPLPRRPARQPGRGRPATPTSGPRTPREPDRAPTYVRPGLVDGASSGCPPPTGPPRVQRRPGRRLPSRSTPMPPATPGQPCRGVVSYRRPGSCDRQAHRHGSRDPT